MRASHPIRCGVPVGGGPVTRRAVLERLLPAVIVVVIAAVIAAFAVMSVGYPVRKLTDLNDSGIWVTNDAGPSTGASTSPRAASTGCARARGRAGAGRAQARHAAGRLPPRGARSVLGAAHRSIPRP